MALEVSSAVIDVLLERAQSAHPDECCGILFGRHDRVLDAVATRNVHPRPASHFEIDPQALIDAYRAARNGGAPIAGFYHSHPNGQGAPSEIDSQMAASDGMIWAIVAAGRVSFWRLGDAGFEPLPYETTHR